MIDNSNFSRRHFLKATGISLAGLTILPSHTVYGLGHPAPSNKLNIAAVGLGGVGFKNLNNLANENIVALCDVDSSYAQKAFRRWTGAKRYVDYRQMLDAEKNIDAVVIATPDHTHGVIAAAALQLQKHIYLQAPMAHSIFEVRKLVDMAHLYGVAAQVGNRVASSHETRWISEVIWSGILGEIKEIHAWTKDPKWKQSDFVVDKRSRIPSELNWDLFVGPSLQSTYHSLATPNGWHAMWSYGNGSLGSMAPHLLEPAFRALRLGAPNAIEAGSSFTNLQYTPDTSKVVFHFPRRDNLPKVAMPALKLYWYDGGLMPERPNSVPQNEMLGDEQGGLIFIGDEGVLICGTNAADPRVYIQGEQVDIEPMRIFSRIEKPFEGGHELDWVRACKESAENRLAASAELSTQQALTETILIGNMGLKLQQLNRKLLWNSAQMRFDNLLTTDELIFFPEKASFDNVVSGETVNAIHFTDRMIRPLYRQGWKL